MSDDQGVPEEQDAVRRLRKAPPATKAAATAKAAAPATPAVPAKRAAKRAVAARPEPTEQPSPRPKPAPTPTPPAASKPEPEPEAEAEPVRSSAARIAGVDLRAAVALLVLFALVSAALLAVTTNRLSDRQAAAGAGEAALSAATSGVQTVLSYNYKTLTTDFAHADAVLTPSFRKLYDATTAKGVEPLAAKYKAVSSAQVSAGGVVTAAADRAEVLVFVSQQVTNSQLAAPRLDRSRIRVDLVKSGDHWLIDKLTPV